MSCEQITLAAMVRRISRIAEQMFSEEGGMPMIWLVDMPDEGMQMIATPHDGSVAQKDLIAAGLRKLFAEQRVTRYAMAAEAWTAMVKDHDDESLKRHVSEHRSIENFPARGEAVVVWAEDDREMMSGFREIVRSEGRKPYLTKLEVERQSRSYDNRFAHLLPNVGAVH